MFKEKLEELKVRCKESNYDLVYSETSGIATVTIIAIDDEENVYGWYEEPVSSDDEREDFLESIGDDIDERKEEHASLQELVPFLKSLIV